MKCYIENFISEFKDWSFLVFEEKMILFNQIIRFGWSEIFENRFFFYW